MQNSFALPVLEMLPVELLAPHEDSDPRRVERLGARLADEALLKNPPVVAQIPESGRYVILDGANRVMAFQYLGVPHIVAQIASYDDPAVTLETWHHVVCGRDWQVLLSELKQIKGLEIRPCSQEAGRKAVADGSAAAYLMNDHVILKLVYSGDPRPEPMQMLHAIVHSYRGKSDIIRASNDIWEIQKPCYPDISMLVVFRRLNPGDILEAGKNGLKIPSGLTRHVIQTRAVNINIPMSVLAADWTLEIKRQWLENWWKEKLAANSIRYYAESTFSFNE
jgi:hypothetical protein